MTKPVSGQTTFGAATSGTTTQLDNNFLLAYNAINDYNTYGNYLADSGSANAMAVTVPAGMTGALTDGLLLQIKVAAANTGATTFNYNGGGALALTNLDGTALSSGQLPINSIVQVQYRASTTSWLLQTPMSVTSVTVNPKVVTRQAIQSAPMDANGLSVLIPASCTSLNLTTANITASAPLVVASANGYTSSGANDVVGISSANLSWNCTANQVNFLGVLVAANGNLTTVVVGNANGVQPTYNWGTSNTNGNGNYTFSIQQMQMLVGNGTATAQTSVVFVGEANCNSNAVVTGTSYAIMARYRSPTTNTLPGASSQTSFSHNIGVIPETTRLILVNITNEAGYVTGEQLGEVVTRDSNNLTYQFGQLRATRNAMSFATGNSTVWVAIPAGGGVGASLTAANWSYRTEADRGW